MTRIQFLNFMRATFKVKIVSLCDDGQKEYTHTHNAFSNFESVAREVGVDKKTALWILAMKHKDGIGAWIKGYRSQREGITGRIYDLIVYLFLLLAIIHNECGPPPGSLIECDSKGIPLDPFEQKLAAQCRGTLIHDEEPATS